MTSFARTALSAVVALVGTAGLVVLPVTPASAAASVETFTFTGAAQSFTVPAGVTSVMVSAEGGHGARSPFDEAAQGGSGGSASGSFAVSPGDVLGVIVGGDAGSGGNNCGSYGAVGCGGYGAGNGGKSQFGGGGGGGSAVTGPDGTWLVAGGGGGSGAGENCSPQPRSAPGNGGAAGSAGGDGAGCVAGGNTLGGGGGGQPGTQAAPGAGGSGGAAATTVTDCFALAGRPGTTGAGTTGASTTDGVGGAGGGGWFGGGSGGWGGSAGGCGGVDAAAGGGGGGSSHVDASALTTFTGVSDRAFGDNGRVVISYTPPPTDTTAPQIDYQITGTLGQNGWYTDDVQLAWTVTEAESPNSLATTGCTDQTITTDQAATTYSCSASSDGGPADAVEVTIKRDATAPTDVSGAPETSPDGAHGWYRSPVGFTFTGSDAGSGIASCSTPTYSGPDGAAVTTTGTCTDKAGNTTAPVTSQAIAYDATAPTLAPVVSPTPVQLRGPASAAPHASEATSGVATSSCGSMSTATTGAKTVTCTATDNAGNTASVAVPYVVQYATSALLSPAPNSKWKAGSTVPVKVQLRDANGKTITNTEAAALGCRVTFTASGAQTATGCLTYNATTQLFQYNWKLGKATGAATATITISYPGTTTTTKLSTPITITR